ncbi:hypothetical protein DSM110093_04239 (plasmid) [Sulfitobacter sp. DSM 110093]|uniref:hypothetical protein n=1 Tax=Sulfitobacter sp. DSM 110093 TaxID=2883127 RepID=UPI001FAC0364|nr:hypothetical protein [Sulfitobacter sp. DSM 110093]UOA34403.1 hypothetical protein DSM110093_04239 [Sulfitobacter sp. DSM 110093]
MIVISNERQLIKNTSFWDSKYALNGNFMVSGNAGAWRLLIPDALKSILPECATAKWVEFHRLPSCSDVDWRIVFEDKSSAPFCLVTASSAFTPIPELTRTKRKLLIYTREGLQQTHQVRRVVKKGGAF